MDLIDRIIQLNNGFPDPLSAYPKHILFYIVPPSIPTISTPIVDEDAALYVHVPFCSRKCSFCFIDITESPTPIDLDLYVETLITEILMSQTLAEKRTIRSIYIGGGTPTILSGEQLSRIIDALHSVFVIAIDAIWEIDATAVTLTASKLESLSSLGIGHLNIGIQSIEKSVLKNIAREWQTDTNLEKVGKLTQEYGFGVHLDFIIGLPGEKISTFRDQMDILYGWFQPRSISINIYEETLYSPDFFSDSRHNYPRYKNLPKLAGLLERYLDSRYDLKREQTPYIEMFHQHRQTILAFGAGAFGYIRNYGMYKNLPLGKYRKNTIQERQWIEMSPQDDKIMFLIHNFSRPDIWYRYRDEFHTRIQDDFPSLVDEDCIESISDDGVLLLRTTDRRDIHKIFTRFYTPHILSLYGEIVQMGLSDIASGFNVFHGR